MVFGDITSEYILSAAGRLEPVATSRTHLDSTTASEGSVEHEAVGDRDGIFGSSRAVTGSAMVVRRFDF